MIIDLRRFFLLIQSVTRSASSFIQAVVTGILAVALARLLALATMMLADIRLEGSREREGFLSPP